MHRGSDGAGVSRPGVHSAWCRCTCRKSYMFRKRERDMKKLRRNTAVLLAVLSALTVALSGCGAGSKAGKGSSVTVGIANDIDSLDPNKTVSAGTREVLFNIYEGLVKPDKDGNLVPAVASAYTISDDATTYTFTIRDGVKFQDGSTVTADDAVYSIERCADASSGNPLAPAFSQIDSVTAPDSRTVVVKLKDANSDFLSYLTTAIVPKADTDLNSKPIGTGPYKVVSRSPQESIVLQKFSDYWGNSLTDTKGTGATPASIENITLKIITDPAMLVTDLKGGAVDLMIHMNATQTAQLGSGFTVAEGTMNLVQALYLNNKVAPFDKKEVRQALCYALDRKPVFEAVSDGKGTAVGSSVYPSYKKYFMPELADAYATDTAKAKELLAKAGYPDGFTFTITVPSNYQQHIDTAQVLSEELKQIGVTAEIRQVEWETWLSDVYQNRNYDATVIGVDASTLSAPALLGRFVSTASDNFTNYSNADYDSTYAEAVSSTDDTAKTEDYKKCEQILSDDAANVYIQDLPDFVGMNSRVSGYTFYPLYVMDLSALKLAQ
jgi:peptide/nickel transport system substrate-binding protein